MPPENPQSLRDVILAEREEILRRWSNELQEKREALSLLPGELRDHVPTFLDDLASALGAVDQGEPFNGSFRPSIHGRERLRVGFDVDAVVREYGLLGDVILRVADFVSYRPTPTEYRALFRELVEAASRAVGAYVRRRDEEQQTEAGKHVVFVAHELRTPLSSAAAALASLKPHDRPPRPVQVLERSIGRIRDLVDNMLVAGRLDSYIAVHLEQIVVRDLLSRVREDILPHAEERGIAIRCVVPESLTVEGDARLLDSALGNLVHNAVKFTKRGGEVVIRGRETESKVILEIEDQCGGIPGGKADELFQPFVQRGGDRSGFGLGLSIAKQAVTAHRGRIYAVDRPGSGCTFTIELPLR
jgi:signal transduction histidine kinase